MAELTRSRREFLKAAGAVALASVSLPKVFGKESDFATPRYPNVVLMVSDDLGACDLTAYGATDLHIPHLDALVRQSMRFTQFYSTSPICSPARASILTGRYPQRTGVFTNAGGSVGLSSGVPTMADIFKSYGYRTGVFGKWHLGLLEQMHPLNHGFDEFFGHLDGCIDNYSHYFYWGGPNRHDLWKDRKEQWECGKFFPDLVVRQCCRFIEENHKKPFFLYVPFNQPHYPLQSEEQFKNLYKDMSSPRRFYASCISSLDDKVGKIVAKLDSLGLRDDTIIIFVNDNGHSVEERTFGGGGSAGPYRGHKFTLWEGGIRVPCIISWPGHIAQNTDRNQPLMSTALLPTVFDLCGLDYSKAAPDGRSIRSIIENAKSSSPHEALHWRHDNLWAIRRGRWKLVVENESASPQSAATMVFLADLETDVGETINYAQKQPDIVKELTELHKQWLAQSIQQ